MIRRFALILSTFLVASLILFVSISKTACVSYSFSDAVGLSATKQVLAFDQVKRKNIDYTLAYPGRILPDSPLWQVKALRDWLWFSVTFNVSRKAELALLFADKRLVGSATLFERKKYELAFSTLTKAEKYLEEAARISEENRKKGIDTSGFDSKLANASLKHREKMEEILLIAPEDVKPQIIKALSYSTQVYAKGRDALLSKGLPVPENPFNGN